jgi:hypothetical protein
MAVVTSFQVLRRLLGVRLGVDLMDGLWMGYGRPISLIRTGLTRTGLVYWPQHQ